MAWVTPVTSFANGDLLTATHMNNIGGDLAEILAGRTSITYGPVSGFSTTSTSYTNITSMSCSITIVGTVLKVYAFGQVYTGNATYAATLGVNVNSTDYDLGTGAEITLAQPSLFFRRITGLTPGTFTVQLRLKIANAATSAYFDCAANSALRFVYAQEF